MGSFVWLSAALSQRRAMEGARNNLAGLEGEFEAALQRLSRKKFGTARPAMEPITLPDRLCVTCERAMIARYPAILSCFGARIRLASQVQGTPCGNRLYPLFLVARTIPIRRLSSRSQEPRSCACRQARVEGP